MKVIDKENGGHGSGVNAGLKAAEGLYFKVVDSDDWLDTDALNELLGVIKLHLSEGRLPDLYVTNFIYDRVYDGTKHVSSYEKKMPQGKIFGWDGVKKFRFSHMMLMHALLYKRENLLKSGTRLPEHTFYVDNIFAYKPLPFMQTVYYLNVIKKMPKGLKNYMWHSLEVIMMTTLFFTCAEYSKERKENLKALWRHIKERDKKLYKKLRHGSYATAVNYLSWRLRGFVMSKGYDILCLKVKLG